MPILRMSDLPPPVPWALEHHMVLTHKVVTEVEALQSEALRELADVEAEIDRLAERRTELLDRLRDCRDALYSSVHEVYHWAKQALPIDPDAMPVGRREVRGAELRAALAKFIESADRPIGVNELRRLLGAYDLRPPGDPARAIADALRWEVRAGRVAKVRRGFWASPGYVAGA